jgi:hypothetical protein
MEEVEIATNHEVGHVCLYLHFGYRIKNAMVEDDTGEVSINSQSGAPASTWIISRLAGYVAECYYQSIEPSFDEFMTCDPCYRDRSFMEQLSEEQVAAIEESFDTCVTIIIGVLQDHVVFVEALAAKLAEKGTLTGSQVHRLYVKYWWALELAGLPQAELLDDSLCRPNKVGT